IATPIPTAVPTTATAIHMIVALRGFAAAWLSSLCAVGRPDVAGARADSAPAARPRDVSLGITPPFVVISSGIVRSSSGGFGAPERLDARKDPEIAPLSLIAPDTSS